MTATWYLAATAVSVFLILFGITTFHLVLTLRQTRQTAQVLEEYLASTRPGLEEAIQRLGSVLGRTDQILAVAEKEAGRLGGAADTLANRFGSMIRTLTAVAAAAGTINHVIKLFTGGSGSPGRGKRGGNR